MCIKGDLLAELEIHRAAIEEHKKRIKEIENELRTDPTLDLGPDPERVIDPYAHEWEE